MIRFLTCVTCWALVALCGCTRGRQEGFTLWQLPSQADDHGNSYVIRTPSGRVVAIDGGKAAEADYLRGFLAALGNEVDAWIVTHPHFDHVGAMNELLRDRRGLRVHRVYESRFTPRMIDAEAGAAARVRDFYALLDGAADIETVECWAGDEFAIDGVRFRILSQISPEITLNVYNNSSMAFRVWDDAKSVVFLGDLGIEGGDKLLASAFRKDLDCDYLQMAHHGQNGCSERFYKSIRFRACLWPTATWLYDNDKGGGFDTGPWKSVETRRWMEEKGIAEHYVSCDGLHRIDR